MSGPQPVAWKPQVACDPTELCLGSPELWLYAMATEMIGYILITNQGQFRWYNTSVKFQTAIVINACLQFHDVLFLSSIFELNVAHDHRSKSNLAHKVQKVGDF